MEKEYQSKIKECIKDTIELNEQANPNTLWEVVKGSVRNTTIKYATHRKLLLKSDEKRLLNEIEAIETELGKPNIENTDNIMESLLQKKQMLDEIRTKNINGHILRSKAIHVENNEKNTRYFANLEKKHSEKKTIYKLKIMMRS